MSAMTKPAKTDKPFMRRFFMEKRKILIEKKNKKQAFDLEIQARVLISEEYRRAKTILIYAARKEEIATDKLILAALANHKTVALPFCLDDGEMRFHAITSPADLVPGRFGIREPRGDCPEVVPDGGTLCICPALGCDMRGYRLGWGGGYYDRYLAKHDCVKAALCYADSLIPGFEAFDYDIRMDLVYTESFVRRIMNEKGGSV